MNTKTGFALFILAPLSIMLIFGGLAGCCPSPEAESVVITQVVEKEGEAVVVTAAAEQIPQPLIDQLADGGLMIIPVGRAFEVQNLVIVTKKKGEVKMKRLFAVRFVPFTREQEQ